MVQNLGDQAGSESQSKTLRRNFGHARAVDLVHAGCTVKEVREFMRKSKMKTSAAAAAAELRLLLCVRPFRLAVWSDALAPDCHVRVGNEPPAVGRADALAALGDLIPRTAGFGGRFWDSCSQPAAIYIETDAQFHDDSGRAAEIPCAIVVRPPTPPIQDLRFYIDSGPLPAADARTHEGKQSQ